MAGIKIVAGQFGDEGNDWVRRLKQNYAGDESGGTSTYYEVFPGVTIFLNRVSASSCVEKRDRRNAMEINFCANGRFECWFEPDDLGVLVPGDVHAVPLTGSTAPARSPGSPWLLRWPDHLH